MVVVLLSLFHVDILNSIGNGLKQVFQLDNFFFFFSLYVFLLSFSLLYELEVLVHLA